ncbi:MAG: hypothetical protein K2N95_16210 [Lachnospiraceae bacterium]|nr:hypothetical protein [Lachnospiraceae bacterium]
MINDILTPMNHREIEYNAKKLSGCDIPDSFACDKALLEWLDETGKRVFDKDLVMDYGTDCLRLYLLFEHTPRENDAPYYDSWQEGALEGIYKFLGRYRRMILAADEWNRCGNYSEETLQAASIGKMNQALEDTAATIRKCISRGNTMPNRHKIVSAMMELLNVWQKELQTGAIITSFHEHAVKTAVPHGETAFCSSAGKDRVDQRNPDVTALCWNFVILMAPYAPDLSRILWKSVNMLP